MIIARIIGGLGNQMFQYAASRCLAQRLGVELKLDITEFLLLEQQNDTPRDFQLNKLRVEPLIANEQEISNSKYVLENILQKFLRKRRKQKRIISDTFYKEPHYHFDQNFFSCKDNTYLHGYWQSEKYFEEIKEILQGELIPVNRLSNKNAILAEKISTTNAISIHVRRGDYISNIKINEYHGACGINYYLSAMEKIASQVENPWFFVFSDDIEWGKRHLATKFNTVFVDHNGPDDACEDLRLMSFCKHQIIANSSFSWWGAWLNTNQEKIVIVPKKWFANAPHDIKDLLPDSWVAF